MLILVVRKKIKTIHSLFFMVKPMDSHLPDAIPFHRQPLKLHPTKIELVFNLFRQNKDINGS